MMKLHLFDSWHFPHFFHTKADIQPKDDANEAKFDMVTLLAFSIAVPLLVLGGLSLMQILFDWTVF